MRNSLNVDIVSCVKATTLLGRSMGEDHLPILLAALLRANADDVITLDFSKVTNITASYLAATIVPLLRMIAAKSLHRYLILRGLDGHCEEELNYVLNHERTPVLSYAVSGELKLLGPLDEAYSEALRAVLKQGSVRARELHTAAAGIGHTGWIKRLTMLHDLGLVKKTKHGREFTYQTLSGEDQHG